MCLLHKIDKYFNELNNTFETIQHVNLKKAIGCYKIINNRYEFDAAPASFVVSN